MISDGELRQMIREGERLGYSTIVEALVELEAYRRPFSEPVAYEWETNTEFGVSKEIPKIPEDCYISIKGLYRKPTMPEQEI